jgi:hypothetical protein
MSVTDFDEEAEGASFPPAKVGYRCPPEHSQFKPGQSGNPSGRAKGSQNFKTLFNKILNEEISLREGSDVKKLSKAEAIVRGVVIGALKGDVRNVAILFRLAEQADSSRSLVRRLPRSDVSSWVGGRMTKPMRSKLGPSHQENKTLVTGKSAGKASWPADDVQRWPIERLVPYARNARTHSDIQISQIAASIREWGWTNPVLVAEDGTTGHGRVLAAQKLRIANVPVMVATGWSEAQRRAYTIADNKLTLNGGWDQELLGLEIGELEVLGFDLDLIGFSDEERASLAARATDGLTDPDVVPDLPSHPVTRPGDLWLLGSHRLICGDSTCREDAARLLAGDKPHLMVTRPALWREL